MILVLPTALFVSMEIDKLCVLIKQSLSLLPNSSVHNVMLLFNTILSVRT